MSWCVKSEEKKSVFETTRGYSMTATIGVKRSPEQLQKSDEKRTKISPKKEKRTFEDDENSSNSSNKRPCTPVYVPPPRPSKTMCMLYDSDDDIKQSTWLRCQVCTYEELTTSTTCTMCSSEDLIAM